MRLTGVNFEAIPPLHLPFRFYLVAPLFAVAGAIMLILHGESLWLSRWLPAALAITHLFALGVMAMVMIGSLYQIMPVLCGAPVSLPEPVYLLIQSGLVAGTLLLCTGFMGLPTFSLSFYLLAFSLGIFVLTTANVLLRHAAGLQTRLPISFALLALGIVVIAGLLLLAGYIWHYFPISGKGLTHLHAGSGIFGWVLLLIMAVSFQVIPMFHVTPEFPKLARSGLPLLTLIGLFSLFLEMLLDIPLPLANWLLALAATLYATSAIHCLRNRKRKLPDVVIRYWFVTLGCLIAASLLLATIHFMPQMLSIKLEVLIGMLLGFGFILGLIQGMLLKIVPFLINLHLQRIAMLKPAAMMLLPDHYALISRRQGNIQFRLYLAGLLTLAISFLYPPLSWSMGVAVLLNWLWIGNAMVSATLAYRRIKLEMLAS